MFIYDFHLSENVYRLEILQTLATLPIPNKTMLQDSKVLATVEKWSAPDKEGGGSPLDSDSNSPKQDADSSQDKDLTVPSKVTEKKETDDSVVVKTEIEIENVHTSQSEENDSLKIEDEYEEEFEIRRSVGMDIEFLNRQIVIFPKHTGAKLIEELANMFEDIGLSLPTFNEKEAITLADKKESKKGIRTVPAFNYEEEIVALAIKLLEEWASLKEVFRIPKKERIEQMKEHEREADKKYKALLGLEQESTNERKSLSRYRYLQRHRSIEKIDSTERNRKGLKVDDRNASPRISKLVRRQLFALKVEHEEEERRRKQQWRQSEQQQCTINDPRYPITTDPNTGYQYVWNPQMGQWQTVPVPQQTHYPYSSTVQPMLPMPNMPHYPYMSQPVLPPMSGLPQVSPQKLPSMPPPGSSSMMPQLPVSQASLQNYTPPLISCK